MPDEPTPIPQPADQSSPTSPPYSEPQKTNSQSNDTQYGASPKSPWKIAALILGIVALASLATTAYLLLNPQTQSISQPSDTTSNLTPTLNPTTTTETPTSATSPTPDSTTDWKIFTNTKFNYQFHYPDTWELNRGPGNLTDEQLGGSRDIAVYDPNATPPGTMFSVDTNEFHSTGLTKECTTLEDCVSKSVASFSAYLPQEVTKENEIFMDEQAIRITFDRDTDSYTQTWSHLFVIVNDEFYHFTMYSEVNSFRQNKPFFDQILSTFRFLDE